MDIKHHFILQRLHHSLASLPVSFAVILIILLVSRLFEYIYISAFHETPSGMAGLYAGSIRYDLYMLLILTGQMLVPYLLVSLLNRFLANLLVKVIYFFAAIGNLALILYYGTTSLMLSTDIFGYTPEDIVHITGASGGLGITNLLIFVPAALLLVILFRAARKKRTNFPVYFPLIIFSMLAFMFRDHLLPKQKKYASEQEYYMANNKLGFFLSKTWDYLFTEPVVTEKMLYPYFYSGINFNSGSGAEYISGEYPFLRMEDKSSVLAPFFSKTTGKPNLVFIIVESLGRAYSGDGAYLGSFTPFLDSLVRKSLYWENCLSTAGRTFEALPSILGSLPFGKTGFAESGISMPRHQSILRLLKENGYETAFVYGGDPKFDNMETFMRFQDVSQIIGEKDFGKTYTKLPSSSNGFTWGYGDKEIFKKYIATRKDKPGKPYADVILTLAMHDPYKIPDQEKYFHLMEQLMEQKGFDEARKSEYRKYKENYSTILYFNEALREFFHEFEKREDFKNTIFIITGDHRMSTPPISTQIDRFHVPLIIYSPLLKNGVKFSSFASHLNITPSLCNFLKVNYDIKIPSTAHWIAGQADTAREYRNTLSVPFIRTKSEIIDYIDNGFFLSGDQLYSILPGMDIEPVENEKKQKELKQKFDKFRQDNSFACENDRLAPDSLFKERK